jgi:hypothetical protein
MVYYFLFSIYNYNASVKHLSFTCLFWNTNVMVNYEWIKLTYFLCFHFWERMYWCSKDRQKMYYPKERNTVIYSPIFLLSITLGYSWKQKMSLDLQVINELKISCEYKSINKNIFSVRGLDFYFLHFIILQSLEKKIPTGAKTLSLSIFTIYNHLNPIISPLFYHFYPFYPSLKD